MAEKFDLLVVGGGPGGYVAGIRAAQLGLKAAVVESTHLGGVCLNWGCIPAKALLHSARLYEEMGQARRHGLQVTGLSVDWPAVIGRSREVAERLSKGIEYLFKKYGVIHHAGRGRLVDAHHVQVTPAEGEPYSLEADHIIIATGARPKIFPGLEPDGDRVITARDALVLDHVPESMVIIGAGAIGVEFAYLYSVFGASVTLIEALPAILPLEDADISRELARQFKKRKIGMFTGTTVETIERHADHVQVRTTGDHREVIDAELALVATGVVGNVEDLGLEDIGVAVEQGAVMVDEYCRTAVEHIFAVGDVIGPPWLAHVASAEAMLAVEAITGQDARPIDYGNIPAGAYCHPQVASVGLTEQAARDQGYAVKVGTYPFRALGKSVANGNIDGFVKVIYDGKHGGLLGTHIIGDSATDLISEAALARTLKTTWREVLKTIHPHPTLSEALMEATALAFGESVNY